MFSLTTREGRPMTTQSLQRIVRQVAHQAGMDQYVTAFYLRNTFAVHYLEQCGNVGELQQVLVTTLTGSGPVQGGGGQATHIFNDSETALIQEVEAFLTY